jgi:hypothetical protein
MVGIEKKRCSFRSGVLSHTYAVIIRNELLPYATPITHRHHSKHEMCL